MQRYYFHFEGNRPHTDTTGEMLLDDEAAWREAVRLLRDVEHAVLRARRAWPLGEHRLRRRHVGDHHVRRAAPHDRVVEHAVRPGDSWTLCVSDGDEPVFVLALVTRNYRN